MSVTYLNVMSKLPIPPRRVLEAALDNDFDKPFDRVIVIGVTKDGKEYHATSEADGGIMLWDIERFRHRLMMRADND